MALKRKRSSPALRTPLVIDGGSIAFGSNSSPLPFFFPSCKAVDSGFAFAKPALPYPPSPTSSDSHNNEDRYSSSRDLTSRTRKRHRNTRPAETEVHASTLQRLYDAQRPHAQSALRTPPPEDHQGYTVSAATVTRPVRAQKGTLHNFWKINMDPPKEPIDTEAMDVDFTPENAFTCEDCENLIGHESLVAGETMSMIEERIRCQGCSRRVCDACAIHICWDQRVCLGCANGP